MSKQFFYYRATLCYNGSSFKGFQQQKGAMTIQHELDLALEQVLGEKVTTAGASRTDKGVHALGQVVKIRSKVQMDAFELKNKLNQCLPRELFCPDLKTCEVSFNPIKGSVSKEYRYLFTTGKESRELGKCFIANYPYELNHEKMKDCVASIIGLNDFKNFCVTGSNVKTTVREIFHCELNEVNPHDVLNSGLFPLPIELQRCYEFRIVGTGFLKQMVRLLMAHLWQVGKGRLSTQDFNELLSGNIAKRDLVRAATPRGLYLYRVEYADSTVKQRLID